MEVETEHPNAMRRMSYKEVRPLVLDTILFPQFGCSIFCDHSSAQFCDHQSFRSAPNLRSNCSICRAKMYTFILFMLLSLVTN